VTPARNAAPVDFADPPALGLEHGDQSHTVQVTDTKETLAQVSLTRNPIADDRAAAKPARGVVTRDGGRGRRRTPDPTPINRANEMAMRRWTPVGATHPEHHRRRMGWQPSAARSAGSGSPSNLVLQRPDAHLAKAQEAIMAPQKSADPPRAFSRPMPPLQPPGVGRSPRWSANSPRTSGTPTPSSACNSVDISEAHIAPAGRPDPGFARKSRRAAIPPIGCLVHRAREELLAELTKTYETVNATRRSPTRCS
jgi:hypothetical protein